MNLAESPEYNGNYDFYDFLNSDQFINYPSIKAQINNGGNNSPLFNTLKTQRDDNMILVSTIRFIMVSNNTLIIILIIFY